MVYIKLGAALLQSLKPLVPADKLVHCEKDYYIAYPDFKQIATQHNLQIHKEIGRHDILTYAEMDVLVERARQSPEQRRMIEELRNKREMRQLRQLNPKGKNDYYFQGEEGGSIREMTQSVSFSMAFVFSFFMAGLTGYYFGTYFLGWSLAHSLFLALGFIILTVMVQTWLFILKQAKNSPKRPRPNSRNSQPPPRTVPAGTSKNKKQ